MTNPTDPTLTPEAPIQPSPVRPPQPPMQYLAPPAPPGPFKRGLGLGAGVGLGAGGMLLVLGLIGTVLTALIAAGMSAALAQPITAAGSLETIWGKDAASTANTVRAIPISGPIMADGSDGLSLGRATYGYEIAKTPEAHTASDAAGVALLINTPGGTINGSRAIADAVERYQTRTGKKVVAFVRGMSFSGGMYAMAGVDKIIADHGSLIGSIGVIFGPFERYKDVTAISGTILTPGVETTGGITQEYLSQGEGKDFGNPFRAMTAKERQKLMTGLEIEYNSFVNWVAQNRKISAEAIKSDLGAYIYDGQTAKAKGLIDEQLGYDEAFRDMATVMGIDPNQARFAQAAPPGFWEGLLGAESRVYGYAPQQAAGAPVNVTSVLCVGAPQPLLWHGPFTAVCG
ncbi:MAG: S49 family peptidase [Micropruina sp.]|nr:S49 family peptidase [Micropruina sp.]